MILARCRRISCSLNEDEIKKGRKKKTMKLLAVTEFAHTTTQNTS